MRQLRPGNMHYEIITSQSTPREDVTARTSGLGGNNGQEVKVGPPQFPLGVLSRATPPRSCILTLITNVPSFDISFLFEIRARGWDGEGRNEM